MRSRGGGSRRVRYYIRIPFDLSSFKLMKKWAGTVVRLHSIYGRLWKLILNSTENIMNATQEDAFNCSQLVWRSKPQQRPEIENPGKRDERNWLKKIMLIDVLEWLLSMLSFFCKYSTYFCFLNRELSSFFHFKYGKLKNIVKIILCIVNNK